LKKISSLEKKTTIVWLKLKNTRILFSLKNLLKDEEEEEDKELGEGGGGGGGGGGDEEEEVNWEKVLFRNQNLHNLKCFYATIYLVEHKNQFVIIFVFQMMMSHRKYRNQ